MTDEEAAKWEAKYRASTGEVGPVNRTLARCRHWFPPSKGRALDIAGGSGRHALWLAGLGYEVTLLDISEAALHLARQEATRRGVAMILKQADVDTHPLPNGPWDLILCVHYLNRQLLARLGGSLATGGRAVILHPTVRNLERHSRPSSDYLVQPGELRQLVGGLTIVHFEEGWLEEGRHVSLLVVEKGQRTTQR